MRVSVAREIPTEQERKMKWLISMLLVVAILCVVLAVPAGAAGPVEVSGVVIPNVPTSEAWRPIGKGEDDHYCMVTVDSSRAFLGSVEGETSEHYEILKRGSCESGQATYPSVQRAWGTFTGSMWDGNDMRGEGTCKTSFHGGWYWMDEEGGQLAFAGRMMLHACTGELEGAHAQLHITFVPGAGPPTYTGRAFFGDEP
jgi:hypothetical protein